MPTLIDGYNLMHAMRDAPGGSDRIGRAWMCRVIGDWAAASGGKVTIIFDGAAPAPDLASQIADPRIRVEYSGARTADQAVIDAARRMNAGRRLTVVTSDREVQAGVRRFLARPVASRTFIHRIAQALRAAAARAANTSLEPTAKRAGLADVELDRWLLDLGLQPISNDDLIDELLTEIDEEERRAAEAAALENPHADAVPPAPQEPKHDGLTRDDRDEWLREFGYDVDNPS
jgi:predicted RNA-binding protein with PIN domain